MKKILVLLSVFLFANDAYASASSTQSQRASPAQLQDAQEATRKVRDHIGWLTYYPGSAKMKLILRDAINALPIGSQDAAWKDFLFKAATFPTQPNLGGQSPRWVHSYIFFMETLAGKLGGSAQHYQQECQALYSSRCSMPQPSAFDHWTSSKAYE